MTSTQPVDVPVSTPESSSAAAADVTERPAAHPDGVPSRPFAGVVPPVLTPWTASGELDRTALERLVARALDAGVDGIFALGSSSEVAFMDDVTRDHVLETVIGTVSGQVPVLAGLIDMQTTRVIEHGRRAVALGVAGVVTTTPFYAITGPAEVRRHLELVADALDVPQLAYDVPVCTHTKMDVTMLLELASSGHLVGLKDSSGDDVAFRRLARMNAAAGEPLTLLTGHEVAVDGAYLAGAHGAVPGLANVDPAGYVRLHRAAQAGDWQSARTEQDRLADLFEIVFTPLGRVGTAAGIGAFKTALVHLGVFESNAMSAPLEALSAAEAEQIQTILDKVGL